MEEGPILKNKCALFLKSPPQTYKSPLVLCIVICHFCKSCFCFSKLCMNSCLHFTDSIFISMKISSRQISLFVWIFDQMAFIFYIIKLQYRISQIAGICNIWSTFICIIKISPPPTQWGSVVLKLAIKAIKLCKPSHMALLDYSYYY